MKTSAVVDYYFLKAILVKLKHADSAALIKVRDTAQEYLDELVPNLAEALYAYLFLASMGEARHAAEERAGWYFSPSINEMIKTGAYSASGRQRVYMKTSEYDPKLSLPKLELIFDQSWHSGGYGGPKWLNIVKSAELYWKHSNDIFIDRVIDVQHNGGSAFDKDVSEAIPFETNYGLSEFLTQKATMDLLADPHAYLQMDKQVYYLLKTMIGLDAASKTILPMIEVIGQDTWTWTPVKWGTKVIEVQKKWRMFADVQQDNSMPSADFNNLLKDHGILPGQTVLNIAKYYGLPEPLELPKDWDVKLELLWNKNCPGKSKKEMWDMIESIKGSTTQANNPAPKKSSKKEVMPSKKSTSKKSGKTELVVLDEAVAV